MGIRSNMLEGGPSLYCVSERCLANKILPLVCKGIYQKARGIYTMLSYVLNIIVTAIQPQEEIFLMLRETCGNKSIKYQGV